MAALPAGAVLGSIVAVATGAALGALLRWLLAMGMNHWLPQMPPGTLVANLVGGYLIGLALVFFARHSGLPPQWQLFVITGFLGGLTTFSTFSAEVTRLLQDGRLGWAVATIGAHLAGSLLATAAGLWSGARLWRG